MNKEENKSALWTIMVIGLLVILILSFILLTNSNEIDNTNATEQIPGTEDELIVLDPNTQTNYSESSCKLIAESNTIIDGLFLNYNPNLGDIDPQDNESMEDNEYSELIQDNYICTKYWKFTYNYNNLDVCVDANSGEIIMVQNSIMSNGAFSLQDAITAGQNSINSFCPGFGSAQPTTSTLLNLSSIDDGSNLETVTGYELIYRRQYEGIDTADQIVIEFDTSGNLISYVKVWNMIMPNSTTPSVTSSAAINIAKSYLENTGDADATLMIVRPNYYWQGEGPRYGFSQGNLCWIVTMEVECEDEGETYYYTIASYVDAITGDIVGGF